MTVRELRALLANERDDALCLTEDDEHGLLPLEWIVRTKVSPSRYNDGSCEEYINGQAAVILRSIER